MAPDLCHCFAARQAARVVTQIYDKHLKQLGLTGSQFTILSMIRGHSSISVAELADELGMERTSVVRALKPLYRDGFITDAPCKSDSRRMLLSLTKNGQSKHKEAVPLWQSAQNEWAKKIGSERANNIRDELISITKV